MSSSSASTQKPDTYSSYDVTTTSTSQADQAGVCFVLNECSDDPHISAKMVGQNIHLPTEPTEQIPLTLTASAAVDIKDTATFDMTSHG